MNDAARFFFATIALVVLTLLTALSPALGAMAANLIRPAVDMVAKRTENLHRYRRQRQRPAAPASEKAR